MIQLNAEWTDLMNKYEDGHSDPRNQLCHQVGIPLIAASFPVGATIIGLPPMALKMGEGSESYAPLALALVGGLSLSLIMTIFVVPAGFYLAYRNR